MCGALSTFLALVLAGAQTPVEKEPAVIEIGGRRELFVDEYLIERFGGGARLILHRPTMREVVMEHDKPWEGNTSGYHTFFKDGEVYRMYYRGWHHEGEKEAHSPVTCYAESKDGIHWKRPDLGLFEFKGSKANNIVWMGKGTHNFVPFPDRSPACKPEQRYKALGGLHEEGGLFAFQSADGIRWSLMADEPVITSEAFAFDSQNIPFWDSVRGEYRAYFRAWRRGYRDIRTTTSRDFLTWAEPAWLAYPGVKVEHLYENQVQPYERAPHLFVGFPARYLPDRDSLVEGLFMTSRDGVTFHRWGEAIIRPGLNPDRWHNRSNYIWLGLLETKSDLPGGGTELSLYSNERYYKGKGGKVRRYTYRLDGFVSVNAPLSGGEILTKPITFAGGRLHLNVSTSAAGSVRVELQDASGTPIPGFALADCPALFGDEIDRVVAWKGGPDVADLAGRPVRLRFVLSDADLYAMQFK